MNRRTLAALSIAAFLPFASIAETGDTGRLAKLSSEIKAAGSSSAIDALLQRRITTKAINSFIVKSSATGIDVAVQLSADGEFYFIPVRK